MVPTYSYRILDVTPYLGLCTAIQVQNNINSVS